MGTLATQAATALDGIEDADNWQSAAGRLREVVIALALKIEDLEQRVTVLEEEPPST